jgi:hypothetical protein
MPKKADAEQTLQATHSRALPGDLRVSLSPEFEKGLSFHELISSWFKSELREPVKNERIRSELPRKSLHHKRTRRIGRWFEILGNRAARSSYLGVVQGHTNDYGLSP